MITGPKPIVQFEQFAADFHACVPINTIADTLGVSQWVIRNAITRAGHSLRKGGDTRNGGARKKSDERFQLMRDAHKSGLTLEQIGQIHGVTRERVRQILAKAGITAKDGGKMVKSAQRRQLRSEQARIRLEVRCMEMIGCPLDQVRAIAWTDERKTFWGNKIIRGYLDQKRNAIQRGIEFKMSFTEWWSVWQQSGHWEERGRGRYVMARKGDIGPYAIGNVYICTQSQNSKDSYIKTPAHVRAAKRAITMAQREYPPGAGGVIGRGRGWTYNARCKNRPYQVVVQRSYIGTFATEEEARAAYLAECERRRSEQQARLKEAA